MRTKNSCKSSISHINCYRLRQSNRIFEIEDVRESFIVLPYVVIFDVMQEDKCDSYQGSQALFIY